jgi:hypothetical protein
MKLWKAGIVSHRKHSVESESALLLQPGLAKADFTMTAGAILKVPLNRQKGKEGNNGSG